MVCMKGCKLFVLVMLSVSVIATSNKDIVQVPVKETLRLNITKPINYGNPVEACANLPRCKKIAEVIIYEARGEPDIGKVAVGHVVLNRLHDPRWPNSVRAVVHQKKQFSYLEDKHKQKPPTVEDRMKAKKIAWDILTGKLYDVTGGATHYHATRVNPRWANKLQYVAQIGQHKFYK